MVPPKLSEAGFGLQDILVRKDKCRYSRVAACAKSLLESKWAYPESISRTPKANVCPTEPAIQKEIPVYIILYIYIIGKPWHVTSWQPPWCSGCTSTPMRKGPSASAALTASFQSRRKIWKAWIPSFPVYPKGFLWPYPPVPTLHFVWFVKKM